TAVRSLKAALDRDDVAGAVRELAAARDADAGDARVIEMSAELADRIRPQLASALDTGRLDLAESLSHQLATVCGENPEVQQFRRGLEQCRSAWQYLESGQPARAAEILKRISLVFPSASWIEAALVHMKAAEAALAELRGGPLALL